MAAPKRSSKTRSSCAPSVAASLSPALEGRGVSVNASRSSRRNSSTRSLRTFTQGAKKPSPSLASARWLPNKEPAPRSRHSRTMRRMLRLFRHQHVSYSSWSQSMRFRPAFECRVWVHSGPPRKITDKPASYPVGRVSVCPSVPISSVSFHALRQISLQLPQPPLPSVSCPWESAHATHTSPPKRRTIPLLAAPPREGDATGESSTRS